MFHQIVFSYFTNNCFNCCCWLAFKCFWLAINSLIHIHFVIFSVKNFLNGITFEPVIAKKFFFALYQEQICHIKILLSSNFQDSRTGKVLPYHSILPVLCLMSMPILVRKSVPKSTSYLQELSNIRAFCSKILLFCQIWVIWYLMCVMLEAVVEPEMVFIALLFAIATVLAFYELCWL